MIERTPDASLEQALGRAEGILGVRLPEPVRTEILRDNQPVVVVDVDGCPWGDPEWELLPVPDRSTRKTTRKTLTDNVLTATHQRPPGVAVVLGCRDGDLLVWGSDQGFAVWDHETRVLHAAEVRGTSPGHWAVDQRVSSDSAEVIGRKFARRVLADAPPDELSAATALLITAINDGWSAASTVTTEARYDAERRMTYAHSAIEQELALKADSSAIPSALVQLEQSASTLVVTARMGDGVQLEAAEEFWRTLQLLDPRCVPYPVASLLVETLSSLWLSTVHYHGAARQEIESAAQRTGDEIVAALERTAPR